MSNSLPFIVNDNLQIEVNVIGYKTIGESSVIFIKSDSVVVFSAIVDCYQYRNVNKTIEILESNNVKVLDYICWTHPDYDHSEGMVEVFNKFVSRKTIINIPENAEVNKEECSQKVIELFNELYKDSKKNEKKYNIYTVSDMKDLLFYCDPFVFLHNNLRYELEMKSFAPNSNLIREEWISKKFSKNSHSIAFLLQFADRIFMFTGDVENDTINKLNKNKIPCQVFFLKIPHHGSKSAEILYHYMDSIETACVTTYKRGSSDLPELEILDKYNNICKNLFMTSSKDDMANTHSYGIVRIEVDVLNDSFETDLLGNAIKYAAPI